jgi:hypothetical protein
MPPPVPVPTMTPKHVRAPRAAPSTASDSAKQLASLAQRHLAAEAARTGRPQTAADQPGRVGVLHQPAGWRRSPGHPDARPLDDLPRLLELLRQRGHASTVAA